MPFRWYVAQTKPNAEAAAERRLRKQNFVNHFPRLSVRVVHRGQVIESVVPLLPSYIFVLLNLDANDDRWKRVNSTRAISHLLPASDRPLPIPSTEIHEIIQAEFEGFFRKGQVQPGQRLRVFRGELANQIIECLDSVDGRVSALWACMGQKVKVSVPLDDVTVYG